MSNRKIELEGEMVKCGVTREDLCQLLHLSYPALQSKIVGKTEFKCDEMFAIQKRLGTDMTLDKLFAQEVENGKQHDLQGDF